jgi:hypothetical protein
MDEAVTNHATLGGHLLRDGIEDLSDEGVQVRREVGAQIVQMKAREFMNTRVVLDYHYEGSRLVVPDECARRPAPNAQCYVPCACPGHLALHLWLDNGSSLYDGFGPGFTLLVTDGSDDAPSAVDRAIRDAHANVPLTVLAPHLAGLADPYEARHVLIRPD